MPFWHYSTLMPNSVMYLGFFYAIAANIHHFRGKKHQHFNQIIRSNVVIEKDKCHFSMVWDEDQGNKLSNGAYFFA